MSIEQLKVPADTLSRTFGPDDLQFETTDEIETLVGTVGQPGAISALEQALDIDAAGFNSNQRVMAPKTNLMLKDEVVKAVQEGRFTIYAVSTIDEGIEVLTGAPAGEAGEDRAYPEGSVHYLVEERLREMGQKAWEFRKPQEDDNGAAPATENLEVK